MPAEMPGGGLQDHAALLGVQAREPAQFCRHSEGAGLNQEEVAKGHGGALGWGGWGKWVGGKGLGSSPGVIPRCFLSSMCNI